MKLSIIHGGQVPLETLEPRSFFVHNSQLWMFIRARHNIEKLCQCRVIGELTEDGTRLTGTDPEWENLPLGTVVEGIEIAVLEQDGNGCH